MVQATGVRIGWRDLPAPVQRRIEEIIGGGPVVEAVSQAGGFSPGTADRVRTADGCRAFVKAVTPAINEMSATLARQEMLVTAALPEQAPVPRMLGGFDTGDWVVLVLADVEGAHPRTPWVQSEMVAAATALRDFALALTPAPAIGLPTAAEQHTDPLTSWDKVAADPPADLDPWEAAHLPELRAAAARSLAALATGDTLVHADIRADNLLVRPDGRVIIVDWPWACVGPAWLDTALLAMEVVMHGGDADPILAGPIFADVDPAVVTDFLAGLTGMFRHAGRLPPPPGLPTVRAFQRWSADSMRPWLSARMGR